MSSLRDFDRVEDRIRQHRQVEKRPVLLVEGPDDLLVLKNHVPAELIFPADGRPNVLRAVDKLHAWDITGIRAVIDSDFDNPRDDERVVAYERRDLEGMLIHLGALKSVLEHQGSAEKILEAGGASAVVAQLIDAAAPVARLRMASRQENWGLRFDAIDLISKADRRTIVINLERYTAALVQASDTDASLADVRRAAVDYAMDDRGPRGRDVVALAGLALRHKVGGLSHSAAEEVGLSAQVRSSCSLVLERSAWMTRLRAALETAAEEVERNAA